MNQLPVGEHLRIETRIGGGGFGQVYRAVDLKLDRPVAVKMLQVLDSADPAARARFEREAKVLCLLNHPHIVRVFNYGINDDGQPYIVMQLLDGETLGDLLRREGKIDPTRAAAIMAQAADAVSAAHARGIVHRDLKPDNIMLDKDDHVTVVDFGLSGFAFGAESDIQKLTQTGQIVGTVIYMSPEVCLGSKATPQTDIYALGCILYHCIVGRPPFEGNDPLEQLRHHINSAPKQLPPDAPHELELIAFKAMQKDPSKRFMTASEFEQALRAVLGGSAPDVHKDDAQFANPNLNRHERKRTRLLPFIAGLILLICAAIVLKMRGAENTGWEEAQEQANSALSRGLGKHDDEVIAKFIAARNRASNNSQRYQSDMGLGEIVVITGRYHARRLERNTHEAVQLAANASERDLAETAWGIAAAYSGKYDDAVVALQTKPWERVENDESRSRLMRKQLPELHRKALYAYALSLGRCSNPDIDAALEILDTPVPSKENEFADAIWQCERARDVLHSSKTSEPEKQAARATLRDAYQRLSFDALQFGFTLETVRKELGPNFDPSR